MAPQASTQRKQVAKVALACAACSEPLACAACANGALAGAAGSSAFLPCRRNTPGTYAGPGGLFLRRGLEAVEHVVHVRAEEEPAVRRRRAGAGARGEAETLPEDLAGVEVAGVQAAAADG